jgi:Holliday junction resolvase RusA-like endonuclease
MADSMHFFMAMEKVPTATKQQRKWYTGRDGRPHSHPSAAWSKAEDELRARLEPHAPSEGIEGAVALDVTWCFPANGHADGEPFVKPPDTDNLQKGLKDIMTELGWWADDAQVFSEHVTKIHSRVPGIRIDVEEVIA